MHGRGRTVATSLLGTGSPLERAESRAIPSVCKCDGDRSSLGGRLRKEQVLRRIMDKSRNVCVAQKRRGRGTAAHPSVSPPILNPHLSLTKETALDGAEEGIINHRPVNKTDWGKIKWRFAPGEFSFLPPPPTQRQLSVLSSHLGDDADVFLSFPQRQRRERERERERERNRPPFHLLSKSTKL